MSFLICKAVNLILNGRTISWTYALNLPSEQGGAMKVFSYYPVGFFVCIGEPAKPLVFAYFVIHERERHGFFIASLLLHSGIVKAASKASCRRSRLKAAQLHAVLFKIWCQLAGRGKSVRTAFKGAVSYKNLSRKEGTRCQNHSLSPVPCVGFSHNTAHPAVLDYYISNLALSHVKVRRVFYGFLHFQVIFILIRLSAERMNGRTLGSI